MSEGPTDEPSSSRRLAPDDRSPTDAEHAIRGLAQEVAYVFDAVGRQLFRQIGDTDGLRFQDGDLPALRHALVIHNHVDYPPVRPGAPPEDGGSFSATDVFFVATDNVMELRAISRSYRHILARPDGGWPEPEALVEEYQALQTSLKPLIQREVLLGTCPVTEYMATLTHRTMLRLADWGGLRYERWPTQE